MIANMAQETYREVRSNSTGSIFTEFSIGTDVTHDQIHVASVQRSEFDSARAHTNAVLGGDGRRFRRFSLFKANFKITKRHR
jgi:hypothetical protein